MPRQSPTEPSCRSLIFLCHQTPARTLLLCRGILPCPPTCSPSWTRPRLVWLAALCLSLSSSNFSVAQVDFALPSAVRAFFGSRGIDHQAHAGVKCPVISLDLASPGGQELALEMLTRPDVVACHFAPPCGAASAARGIPLRGAPGPLRSRQAP